MNPTLPSMQLTPRQIQALENIARFQARRCYSATIGELADALGVSRATAFEHVAALREKGLVAPSSGRARSLRCTERGQRLLERQAACDGDGGADVGLGIPLAGRVAAGRPIDALEEHEQLSLESLFGRQDVFALQVVGDSMIDAGIDDGDYVVCRKTAAAEQGQLVVAIVEEDTATVKRFYREGGRIRLEPANAAYAPIWTDHCRIEAVVIGLLRRL